jgi:folate-binding protein YgfZ
MLHASLLEDRSVVALRGGETRDFLQGLITNDMAQCAPGKAIYAALLTPQGKILFDFFIVEHDGGFLLDCAGSRANDLLKRLTLYRLRAKVEISPAAGFAVAAVWSDDGSIPAFDIPWAYADPRLPALGLRAIGPRAELQRGLSGIPAGDYGLHRLRLGVPDSADLPPDTVLALDSGLEELNGVSFKKGCYVGQEVTARMKHRATARKRFVIAETQGDLPPPGTVLDAGGREIGALATGAGDQALALVRLDRLAEVAQAGGEISAAGKKTILRKPDWLTV